MKTPTEHLVSAWYRPVCDDTLWWYWPLLLVLWPLSQLFALLARARRVVLQQGSVSLPVPVVVVGNITVGGTGKTPLLCAFAAQLQRRGWRIGIISRGYGGSHRGAPRIVLTDDEPGVVGDEPLLLARKTGCAVAIGGDRVAAARHLLKHIEVDILLSDDGLQHYALSRHFEIAVIDGVRGLGNGLSLPAGPLREPATRLSEVDAVVINGGSVDSKKCRFREDQYRVDVQPAGWIEVDGGVQHDLGIIPAGCVVHAVAGIGHPQRFFETLRSLGLEVIEHSFPDHHQFVPEDFYFSDGNRVVMTEKDAVKCSGISPAGAMALHVTMEIPEKLMTQLIEKISPLLAMKERH